MLMAVYQDGVLCAQTLHMTASFVQTGHQNQCRWWTRSNDVALKASTTVLSCLSNTVYWALFAGKLLTKLHCTCLLAV